MDKTITIVRDIRPGERRVLLQPREVSATRDAGFEVYVESGAGANAGIPDDTFAQAGATIVDRETAWSQPFVVKYKAPEPEEFQLFHPNLTLGAYLHAEDEDDLVAAMCRSGMSAYSFEYFESKDGLLPMATADDEIAGKLSVVYGAYLLQSNHGGSGTLLMHVPGTPQPKVVVIGYGDVGGAAARTAAALGCRVTVLGRDVVRLRKFESTVPPTVTCRINGPEVLAEELRDADLVVGAILISTYDTEPMLTREHLQLMKRGSMIVDVTCGYGDGLGYMPTFHRQTTHDDPVYLVDGVLHCKIDSLPSKVPRTASQATSATMQPHLVRLAEALARGETYDLAERGKVVSNGQLVHPYIRDHLEMKARRNGTEPPHAEGYRPAYGQGTG